MYLNVKNTKSQSQIDNRVTLESSILRSNILNIEQEIYKWVCSWRMILQPYMPVMITHNIDPACVPSNNHQNTTTIH